MNNSYQAIVIGIIGGGQLGKMMSQSAKRQGYQVAILDPIENCPAAQVSDVHIKADYTDKKALAQLEKMSTVVTYEFENVDLHTIESIMPSEKFVQGTNTLKISQNRLYEKEFFQQHHFPVGQFEKVTNVEELLQAIDKIGYPSVLKTTRFGYDGKGQVVLKGEKDLQQAKALVSSAECVLEQFIKFTKEVSVMISRNQNGAYSLFPIAENIHRQNILYCSIVPARISKGLENKIKQLTLSIANTLNLVGTLGVEYFVVDDETVYINEIAPRPHNSGHYSIESCNFSQFDTSIQAILNLPMPNIVQYSPVVMFNVLGQDFERVAQFRKEKANWHFHDYGKSTVVHNRKMGHITILTQDIADVLEQF